jgi:hypothetical protein
VFARRLEKLFSKLKKDYHWDELNHFSARKVQPAFEKKTEKNPLEKT